MLGHVLEREIEREMENVGAGAWAAPLCHVFLKILLMCLLAWRTEKGRRGGGGEEEESDMNYVRVFVPPRPIAISSAITISSKR